ncbi:MAG: cache domain-containing protein [Phycisphaerae bacterium]|nr:cache domain-containing protein [Phycisphaerae bacterium]
MVGRSLKTKMLMSFLAVISLLSFLTAMLGFYLIDRDILYKAQRKVGSDLNFAREVYRQETKSIEDVARLTARRFFLRDAILAGNAEALAEPLNDIRKTEGLDILTLTDAYGRVLVRSRNPSVSGDDQKGDEVLAKVLSEGQPVVGTTIVPAAELMKEGAALVQQVHIQFVPTAKAKPTDKTEQTAGMMIKAAAPVFDAGDRMIGVLYGGTLLNRNYAIVDNVKKIVYQDAVYKGRDVGTVTIFQDDLRISTNVKDAAGSRAIGTRVSAEVYDRVLGTGRPWSDRAFVVKDWYKTCYEPIRNVDGRIVGILYVGTLELPFNDLARNSMVIFVLIILAATVVAVAISYILAGRVSMSLTHLRDATVKLSAGELGHTIETTSDIEELNELAEAFNAMSQELEERDTRLRLSNDMLADLNKRYIDLIGFVSHELKGIVGVIVMNVCAVRDQILGETNERQKKALDGAVRSLDYLTATVKKFLNLGRIEKGELETKMTRVELKKDVFDPTVDSQATLAERKNMTIRNEIHPDLEIDADPELLQVAAHNLLSNAVKYGADWGTIVLRSRTSDDHIEIEVYNDSTPIREDQKARLFQRFSRLDNPETRSVKGTGLGLFITRQIIEKQGGRIWVEPKEKGNAFIVQLPVQAHSFAKESINV